MVWPFYRKIMFPVWRVRGTSLHAQSPPLTSKKTAKGTASEAMLRECVLREVLVLVEEL
jgi:hypothetical protein